MNIFTQSKNRWHAKLTFVLIKTPLSFSIIICHTMSKLQGAPKDTSSGVGRRMSLVFFQLKPWHCFPLALPQSRCQGGWRRQAHTAQSLLLHVPFAVHYLVSLSQYLSGKRYVYTENTIANTDTALILICMANSIAV